MLFSLVLKCLSLTMGKKISLPRQDQMLNLLSLPYEVLANIVGNIDFDDYYSLGLTCTQLQFLLFEDRICKLVVQVSRDVLDVMWFSTMQLDRISFS
jgi:hypothetical protein